MTSDNLFLRMREELFSSLASATEKVILLSPFLSVPIALQLTKVARTSPASWTLVTNLSPLAISSGYLSATGLYKLIEAGVEIRSLERLHAKVYVADEAVFLGSGNLTGAGLGATGTARSNAELGVRLDQKLGAEATGIAREWVQSAKLLNRKDIEAAEAQAQNILARGVLRDRSTGETASTDLERGLWVKLQYGHPDWDGWREHSWFSNSRRSTMKPGDLVLIASKEASASYAIVEVTTLARDDAPWIIDQGHAENDARRWNWVTETEPWLVPAEGVQISYEELGFSGQSLQVGYKRLGVAEFARAVDAFEPGVG